MDEGSGAISETAQAARRKRKFPRTERVQHRGAGHFLGSGKGAPAPSGSLDRVTSGAFPTLTCYPFPIPFCVQHGTENRQHELHPESFLRPLMYLFNRYSSSIQQVPGPELSADVGLMAATRSVRRVREPPLGIQCRCRRSRTRLQEKGLWGKKPGERPLNLIRGSSSERMAI